MLIYVFFDSFIVRFIPDIFVVIYKRNKIAGIDIIFVIVCIALTIIVLMQEGKSAGLTGSISGMADTYWGKNKGRSMEGTLEKITKVLAVLLIVLAALLNSKFI